MVQIPRRNIDELFFLYEVEANVTDIFVEGPFDAVVIKYFLKEISLSNVNVYEISTINVNDQELISANKKANNRERTIWLAEKFDDAGIKTDQLTCIVDKDFCHYLGSCIELPHLLYTDFACMEMYFFNETVIDKFLNACCYREGWPCNRFLGSISNYIQRMYLFRLANEVLNWQMAMLDKVVCITIADWEIVFDEEYFINRFLNKNDRIKNSNEFCECISLYEQNLLNDPRYQMNGHDFISAFSFLLIKKGVSKEISNTKIISRALILTLSSKLLLQYTLFNSLLKRVRGVRDVH